MRIQPLVLVLLLVLAAAFGRAWGTREATSAYREVMSESESKKTAARLYGIERPLLLALPESLWPPKHFGDDGDRNLQKRRLWAIENQPQGCKWVRQVQIGGWYWVAYERESTE